MARLDGSDGHVLWSTTGLSLSEQTYIDPEMVALDDGGVVLVGSFSRGTLQAGNESISQQGEKPGSFIARFDATGQLAWHHLYDDGTSVRDVTLGPDGSVWVAGAVPSLAQDDTTHVLVMQLNPATGAVLHTMPSSEAELTGAFRLAVDADESGDESIVALGNWPGGHPGIGGYSKQGHATWQTTLCSNWSSIPSDTYCSDCYFRDLALDSAGGVFLAGAFCGSMQLIPGDPSMLAVGGHEAALAPGDAVLAHFDRNGALTWRDSYGLPGLYLDPMTLATDQAGGLLTTISGGGVFEQLTDPVQLGCVSTTEYDRGMVLHLPADTMD